MKDCGKKFAKPLDKCPKVCYNIYVRKRKRGNQNGKNDLL
jgi:hypothetical protein